MSWTKTPDFFWFLLNFKLHWTLSGFRGTSYGNPAIPRIWLGNAIATLCQRLLATYHHLARQPRLMGQSLACFASPESPCLDMSWLRAPWVTMGHHDPMDPIAMAKLSRAFLPSRFFQWQEQYLPGPHKAKRSLQLRGLNSECTGIWESMRSNGCSASNLAFSLLKWLFRLDSSGLWARRTFKMDKDLKAKDPVCPCELLPHFDTT